MTGSRRATYGRLTAEFVVIVIGVLVALAVDSFVQEASDRNLERAYLIALEEDLVATVSAAESAIETEARLETLTARLLEALDEEPLPPTDSLALWTDQSLRGTRFRPNSATLEALFASGDIGVVTSLALRRGLVEYRSHLEEVSTASSLFGESSLEAVARINETVNISAIRRGTSPARYPVNWENIASDRVFRGGLSSHWIAVNARGSGLRDLVRTALPLIEAIRSELES